MGLIQHQDNAFAHMDTTIIKFFFNKVALKSPPFSPKYYYSCQKLLFLPRYNIIILAKYYYYYQKLIVIVIRDRFMLILHDRVGRTISFIYNLV